MNFGFRCGNSKICAIYLLLARSKRLPCCVGLSLGFPPNLDALAFALGFFESLSQKSALMRNGWNDVTVP